MTPQALLKSVSELVGEVLADERWSYEKDDLGVSALGMLVYGFALAQGRLVFLLELDEIDEVVTRCLVENVGTAEKWTRGLVAEANESAFDSEHHELIGVGHSYYGVKDRAAVVDNVFANTASVRTRAEA